MPNNMPNVIDAVMAWPVRKKATGFAVIVASVALLILSFSWSQR